MTLNVIELQGKYLNEELNKSEMFQYLEYLESDYNAAFRERRIEKLRATIKSIEKREASAKRASDEQYNAAVEYKSLTDRWVSEGAYFKPLGIYSKWYLGDENFFTSESGMSATEVLIKAKKADDTLTSLQAKS